MSIGNIFMTDPFDKISYDGKRFVTTGLSDEDNKAFADFIKAKGCVLQSAVSGKTDYLIVDTSYDHATVKYKKAVELKKQGCEIKIISYIDFVAGEDHYKFFTGSENNNTFSPERKIIGLAGTAFWSCSGLENALIPEGTISVESRAFWGCDGLTSVTIPNSVKSIGYDAFADCTGLTDIDIPYGVINIGSGAFKGCSSLKRVIIPSSVTKVGEGAFAGVGDALIIYYGNQPFVEKEVFRYYNKGPAGTKCRLYLPGISLSDIPSMYRYNAVCGFAEMLSSDTPKEMQEEYVNYLHKNRKKYYGFFDSFPKLLDLFTTRKLIPFGEVDDLLKMVKSDESRAVLLEYSRCFSEDEKEKALDKKAEKELKKALGFEKLTVAEYKELYDYKNEEDYLVIHRYKGKEETVIVPALIGRKNVKVIKAAFDGNQTVKNIIVSDGVKKICRFAFSNCGNLSSITLPNSISSIDLRAFAGCSNLIIKCSKESYAHKRCSALASIIKVELI
jgi:hypothetical protein